MFLNSWDKYRDSGLLLLRVGLGLMFIYHGYPKILGGTAGWEKLGSLAMQHVGITAYPMFWGFMAAFAEFFGGILLILGLFTRLACIMLVCNLAIAANLKFSTGLGLAGAAPAIEDGIIFLSLILIGPGKYSLDNKFSKPPVVRLRYCR